MPNTTSAPPPSATDKSLAPTQKPSTASILKRIQALFYDSFILTALSLMYWAIATVIMVTTGIDYGTDYHVMTPASALGIALKLGWPIWITGFLWYFWQQAGQTIGMRTWRLELISTSINDNNSSDSTNNNTRISHRQCLIRLLVGLLVPASLGLIYIWCLFDKNGDSLHDRLSQSRVQHTPKPAKGAK
ncbi:MAG: hypothetical protein COA42_14860 [Alteromonadaceae bacterium]|nr:MAG: hypothetical protein COA42_14860 [Alteromonadaceae bacterium]